MENVTLTQKEQTRLQVLNSLVAEQMTVDQAATLMGVKGGGILGHGVSMVSINVRLSDQHKCHPYFARWYQITPNRPVTSSWAD